MSQIPAPGSSAATRGQHGQSPVGFCVVPGSLLEPPSFRNEIGMLFQKQPPDGARAWQLCRLSWYFGNLDSSPNTVFFHPPSSAFKIQVPKVRGSRLDLHPLPAVPPLPLRRQLQGGRGCCLLPGLGTLTQGRLDFGEDAPGKDLPPDTPPSLGLE